MKKFVIMEYGRVVGQLAVSAIEYNYLKENPALIKICLLM